MGNNCLPVSNSLHHAACTDGAFFFFFFAGCGSLGIPLSQFPDLHTNPRLAKGREKSVSFKDKDSRRKPGRALSFSGQISILSFSALHFHTQWPLKSR